MKSLHFSKIALASSAIFSAYLTANAGVGAWTTGNWSSGFTSSPDNLIGNISPSASSGLSNNEGGKNVKLLTDGRGASAKSDVQCLGNDAVLTYTLPQPVRITEVRIYGYWVDSGRSQISVASVAFTRKNGTVETVSPGAITHSHSGFKPYVLLAMANGNSLATEVVSATITFGTQKNNYCGYAEIEICGSAGADDLLLVEGDPDENGSVSPAYGEHHGYSAGDSFVCSAPSIVTNEACTIAAVCTGYKVYTNGVVYLEGNGNSFTYVHPDCISGANLVWQWDSQYLVTATAGTGGTVSPAAQWVARGTTATVTATPAESHGFYQWTGNLPAGTSANSPTISFIVTEPVALTASFGGAYYVSTSGSDTASGATWETAFATVEHALTVATAGGDTIYVGPGTYAISTTLALDRHITIQGEGATFADVTLNAGKARRVAVLSHASATLRNLTLANGYSGSTGTGGGGGCVRVTAGLVESCRITGGKIVRQGYGAGVFNSGGMIRDCVIDGNTAAGNLFAGLGLYQEGAASVTERCVITNNAYSACHNSATPRCSAGLYLAGGLVRDTLIARNDAGELTEAGAIGDGASGVYQTGGTLLNCAVVENRFTKTSMASIDCAGLYRTGGTVANCIVYGNVDGFGNPNDWKGTVAAFTSCVLSTTDGATGDGNVAAASAPYLILANGTFLLPQSSCAVDAGAAHANLGATDLYGNSRRTGAVVDAGPVEYTTPERLVAYFEASVTEGASPLATTFSAVADGPDLTGLTYTWTFSDGTTTTTETTSSATLAHTFTTGTHSISLTVCNGAGDSASLSREGYILVRPLVAYVDPDNASGAAFPYDTPATAAATLAAALEPQVNGLIVHLLPGTHPLTSEVVVKRAVRILGDDPATTFIRGGGKHRLFHLSGPVSAGGALISGVTLLNGYFNSNYTGGSDLCWAQGGGGSLWIDIGSAASNCVVVGGTGTRSAAGYGVYVDGGTFTHSTIRNITVGSTQDISYGTALRVVRDGLVDHCVVSNINDTAHHQNYCGAAVLLTSGTIRNSLVTDVDFFYVSTTTGKKLASGVKVEGGTLDACTIVGNHINDGCAGVYSTGGTIRNCLVAENTNDDGGSDAEWLRDNGTWSYVATTVTNGLPGAGHQLVSSPVCAAGSFMPAPGSAAIGNGLVESWMADATDLAGNPRLGEGGVADIGAFAYIVPSLACSFTASALSGLGSLTATLTATVDGDTDGIVYYWDTDGDGAADQAGPGLSSLSVSFGTARSYPVTLSVTNGAGLGASSAPVILVVSPAVIHVAGGNAGAAFPYDTWATAAASVEDGLVAAGNGTEIIVADGTYALTNSLVLNLGVNLHSAGGSASDVLLYCSGDFRAVSIDNADAVFCGFTVSNGYLGGYQTPEYATGGGDLLLNAGLVENCRFTGARAERQQKGVAVAVAGGTMRDCEIDGNRPRYPGRTSNNNWSEIYYGVGLNLSGGLVERCRIHGNHLADAHRNFICPSGVYMTGGTLRGCLIADNTIADGREGSDDKLVSGLYITGGKVENCTIAGNRAGQYVGGVRATGGNNAGTIRNSIICGNTNTNGVSNTAGADVYAYCCLDSVEGRAGAGMLAADPLFRRPGAGDYRLDAASPCKAAGLYDATWMADFIDLAGLPLASRRHTVPMGCFATAKGATVIFLQ